MTQIHSDFMSQLRYYNKILWTGCLSHSSGGHKLIRGPGWLSSGDSSFRGLQMATFLLSILTAETERQRDRKRQRKTKIEKQTQKKKKEQTPWCLFLQIPMMGVLPDLI